MVKQREYHPDTSLPALAAPVKEELPTNRPEQGPILSFTRVDGCNLWIKISATGPYPVNNSVSCSCEHMELLATVPLLIIDDLGMRKLGPTAGEELLEIVMRRYERASTLLTSNRPVEDWGKLLGDSAAVTAMLDRLLHHGHILKCGPRSWRTKTDLLDQEKAG
jgi:IstB-like ATP binding protein